jgi:hypothetical protein
MVSVSSSGGSDELESAIANRERSDQQFEHHNVLRFHSSDALLGTPREGILVFDDDRLVAANRHGLALLGLERSAVDELRFRKIFANSLAKLEDRCTLRTLHCRQFR